MRFVTTRLWLQPCSAPVSPQRCEAPRQHKRSLIDNTAYWELASWKPPGETDNLALIRWEGAAHLSKSWCQVRSFTWCLTQALCLLTRRGPLLQPAGLGLALSPSTAHLSHLNSVVSCKKGAGPIQRSIWYQQNRDYTYPSSHRCSLQCI